MVVGVARRDVFCNARVLRVSPRGGLVDGAFRTASNVTPSGPAAPTRVTGHWSQQRTQIDRKLAILTFIVGRNVVSRCSGPFPT